MTPFGAMLVSFKSRKAYHIRFLFATGLLASLVAMVLDQSTSYPRANPQELSRGHVLAARQNLQQLNVAQLLHGVTIKIEL
jgi:hypothetical protein